MPVYVEHMPEVEDMRQGVLYVSKSCIAVHLCLCGCGGRVVTPLDKIVTETEEIVTESTEGWWILTEKQGKVSMTPSIGNYDFPCRSHYIITNNTANFV